MYANCSIDNDACIDYSADESSEYVLDCVISHSANYQQLLTADDFTLAIHHKKNLTIAKYDENSSQLNVIIESSLLLSRYLI